MWDEFPEKEKTADGLRCGLEGDCCPLMDFLAVLPEVTPFTPQHLY